MAISIKDFRMAIRIDNSEAKQKFDETKRQLEQVTAAMKKLEAEGKKNTAEWKALKKTQDELNTSLYRQRLAAGRSALTIKELEQGLKQLRQAIKSVKPGTKEWYQYREEIRLSTQRINELRTTATATSVSVGKLSDGFSRYTGMVAGTIASLTGLTWGMQQCVDAYAKMDEAQSQTIKYTGMTREEVEELNEQFKQMDTRTPRQELNRLAGEAGKLGITGVQDVMDFVDAANQINVALGEDLGEEAVNQIGKLSQMFGDESRTLKENMLAIGSAVNQVAQSTSASEPYLVQFTARMGGVGKQADMAVTDIMGFASALDQNMLRSEMASTALSGLIMRIYQEPAKFAEMARLDVQEFTELVSTDVNEAVLQFLESLNKMGGMANIAPILKEMKLSGAEAAGVISTLAGNVELVRREQENANKAFTEATSITNEYTVQNNTAQAQLEKERKKFQEVRVELGEQLMPVMQDMISVGNLTGKGLLSLISIGDEYKGTIVALTASIGLYTVAVNKSVIADKAKALWTGRIVTGTKTLFTLLRSNPWGVVAAGAGVVAGLLVDLKRKQDSVTESMRSMQRINKEASKSYNEQAPRIELLTSIIHNENLANSIRIESLEKLKSIIPGYNGMLTEEGKLINDNTESIESYLEQLEKQIKLKAAQEELEELYRRKRKTEKQLSTDIENEDTARSNLNAAQFTASSRASQMGTSGTRMLTANLDHGAKTLRDEFERASKATQKTREELAGIEQAIKDVNDEIASSSAGSIVQGNKPASTDVQRTNVTPFISDDQLKEEEQRLKSAFNVRMNLAKEKLLQQKNNGAEEKATQDAYNAELYQAEMEYLLKRKALLESAGKDSSEVQGQIFDKMIAEANRLYELSRSASPETQAGLSLGVMDEEYAAEQQRIKQQYIDGDIRSEQEYREKLLEAERDYLEQRREMQAAYGMDTSGTDGRILDMDIRQKQDDRRTQREAGFDAIRDTDDLSQQNALLQAMYDADLITYEEYQEEKTRIAEEQEELRQHTATAAMSTIGQAASAASQLIGALQDAELSKVERKYDKEIDAARKAGKDTTKLEEEKEAAMQAVKKKYADKQFAANVLQVTASTAVAAMNAYSAMAGIPIVGPALGAIAAAAAIAAGAAQIAVAKQQRDEAKGLYSGGYSDEYVEGYTRRGNPRDTAGVIPVHKNEFVANHEAVANPAVRQFLDVFDMAQKKGTIRMLNTTQILEQIRTRSGRYSGGYSDDTGTTVPGTGNPLSGMNGEQRSQVVALLVENNRLLGILCDKELVVDARKVRNGIRHINRLESNVSR